MSEKEKMLIKRCRVCGDVAFAFNFQGHLSCESCKAFFRRSCLISKNYPKCNRGGNCSITMITRNACKSCRFTKCLQIGMREMVTKISRKRREEEALNNPFKEKSPHLQPYHLQALQEVNQAFVHFTTKQPFGSLNNSQNILAASNLAEKIAHQMTTSCSHLPAFNRLQAQQQVLLLKAFLPKMILICAAFSYNNNSKAKQSILAKLLLEIKPKMVTILDRFLRQLHDEMEADVLIKNLLLVYLLFSHSSQANLINLENICYQQTFYWHLLCHYLLHKYQNPEPVQAKVSSLTRLFGRMERSSRLLHQVFLHQTDQKIIAQVLAAIYQLL